MKNIYYIILICSFIYSKNFIYTKDSWYSVTAPVGITSISYNRDEIFLSSNNGLFIYDKLYKNLYYTDSVLANIDNKNIFAVHYDIYRDNIWILNKDAILFKSDIGSVWLKLEFYNLGVSSYRNIINMGSNTNYIVLQTRNNQYFFLDPYTGVANNSLSNTDVTLELLSVNWSSSYRSELNNTINLNQYYTFSGWDIISNNQLRKNGKVLYVNCILNDPNGYKWIGTDSGELFFIEQYSQEIKKNQSIPPLKNISVTYLDKKNEWWIADKDWMYNYSDIIYDQDVVFLCHWNETSNIWTKYYQKKYPHIMSKDINNILRIDDMLYVATDLGLLLLDINLNRWNLLDVTNGLPGNMIFNLEYYEDTVYLGTNEGLATISTLINKPIASFFTSLHNREIYDMSIQSHFIYLLTDLGLLKMNTRDKNYISLSNRKFENIDIKNDVIILSSKNKLFELNDQNKIEMLMHYDKIDDFDICSSYLWVYNNQNALIYNIDTGFELEYDTSDGILGSLIYDVECDEEWVWFSTNNGISFYNWSKYHYEK